MATSRGIPAISPALMRPTTLPAEAEPEQPLVEGEDVDAPADQGRGAEPRATAAARPRRRKDAKAAASEKTNRRGLYLTDSVWDRLQYEAIRRRTTVSAIAGDVLERNLPRFRVEREG